MATSCQICALPVATRIVAPTAVTPITAWVARITLRRGKRSATSPAAGESTSMGTPQPRLTTASAIAEPEIW